MIVKPNETKRQYHNRRLIALKSARTPWESHWQELADFTAPERLCFILNGREGQKINGRIIDPTATYALRTLASGMHSGITSPSRPWFRLTTFDEELKEYAPVKEYLAQVENRMREVFSSSNLYKAFHWGYGDLGLFGQSCGILAEDQSKVIRLDQLLHGSFWIARDETGMANTLYRQFSWSVEKIVKRFGYDKCSFAIRNCWDRGDYDQRYTINHAIEPRHDREPGKVDKRNKPFTSNYWEDGVARMGGADLLEESGFDSNPIIAPPWELIAEDNYAVSPGMQVLPDNRMLQTLQIRMGEAIEKKVRPPMTGPSSLAGQKASLMPGSVTYVDDPTGKGYRPAIEVNISLAELDEKIRATQDSVNRGLYADLFLMLANMEGVQPRNQLEISERKEEKLLALGPVLENIHNAQLSPVIDRTYEIMERRGLLPPPPQELQGQGLKVEYISMLAQAQKAIATGGVERLLSFGGNLAAMNPQVLDKIDMDQAIDIYGELLGTPPSLVVPDDKVKEVRAQRAQAQQQAEQAQNAAALAPAMNQGAQAAKVLAETDQRGANILQQLGITP